VTKMSPYLTGLYVASQTARELVVVDPPYAILSAVFAIIGLLSLPAGFAVVFFARVGFTRPFHIIMGLLPLLLGSPFLITSVVTGRATRITLSADTGKLSVRKTFLSVPVRSREYSLEQVRLIKVGVGDVCRFLYMSFEDKPAEDLTGCTDRTRYSEVADAMNAFLDASRRSSPLHSQDETRIPEGQ
jgi:hypothetical protein